MLFSPGINMPGNEAKVTNEELLLHVAIRHGVMLD
jgi:hypothetical protein